MSRLLVSPDAASRLAAAAAWLDALPRDADVLIVGPTWHACDDFLRGAVLAGGTRFGAVRFTLDRLAAHLATASLASRSLAPATGLSLTAVVARVVHGLLAEGALSYFSPVASRPGFPHAVARTLEELWMNDVSGDALRAGPRGCRDLAEIARAASEELERAGLADRATVFAIARDVATEAAIAPLGAHLLLLDLPLATGREAALAAALAARAPDALAIAPAGDAQAIPRLEEALGCEHEMLEAPPSRAPSAPRPKRARSGGSERADGGATSLATLQRHLFEETSPQMRTLDATVRLTSAPGESRECVEIARAIQTEAARGVPFDRMAILLRSPMEYRAHLEEALRRAAIPAHFARGVARPDSAGRAFLALLACAAEGLSARRFAEYLSLAQVPDVERSAEDTWTPPRHELQSIEPAIEPAPTDTDAPLPIDPDAVGVIEGTLRAPWRWERLLVDASVIGGKDRWERRLRGLEEELVLQRGDLADEDLKSQSVDRALGDLRHLRDFALPLIVRLAALPKRASWGTWLDALQGLASGALRRPRRVLETLSELEPMTPVGPVELDHVQHVLAPRLRNLVEDPSRRRYGAVFITSADAARGLAFDVVFVPGLAEKLFPRKIVEDPLLADQERRGLDGGRLATQETRVSEERLQLRLAVGAAREKVFLSYPRLDTEQARPRVPSFYGLEAMRAAEGRLPGFDELRARAESGPTARLGWPAPVEPAESIDDAEYDLAVLAGLKGADPASVVGAATYLMSVNPALARALRVRARRWLKRWTSADGLVDPDPLALEALAPHRMGARSFSPTALEKFSVCPYQFFLQAIHRLEPREEPVALETIDPLTRGALFHEVQFEVLTQLRAEGKLPVTPDALLGAFNMVDKAVDRIEKAYAERLAPAIPRVWQDGVNAIRADLREWLRRVADVNDGWVPDRFELAFGLADRHRPNADPSSVPDPVPVLDRLKLRGSIDLVERHASTGHLRVTDHKTGKAWHDPGTMVSGGTALQPILYALACEQLLDAKVDAGRLYYCTASGGFEERVVPLDEDSRETMQRVIGTIAEALDSGFLPALPDAGACLRCDYRTVCGPWEETRTSRKPADRVARFVQIRSLA